MKVERVDERTGAVSEARKQFSELASAKQAALIKQRLKAYSHTTYKKTKVTAEEKRVDTVCMREHPFYVDTVT